MHPISMSRFVDFLLTTGPARVTEARSHAAPPFDLYAEWKTTTMGALRHGGLVGSMEHLFPGLDDEKKKRLYPPLVKGLAKFLRRTGATWFEPPARPLSLAPGVVVQVNPELGALIDGVPIVCKLHLRRERLCLKRTQLLVALMAEALGPVAPEGAAFAVLDVERGKLHFGGSATFLERAETVLHADALAYAALRKLR